ncbi:MAG: ABC transporter ATP-binding protein [Candidatus Woesearchaeota archaeon]|nr:ABC transporter ATP-binding protein [Candidatus Woesearchaeota archaeon]
MSLSIRKGEFIGILGANGSGKSTLALNIIGLLQRTGSITLSGKEISKQPTEQRAKNIGYVFQNPNYQLFEQTVKEEIGFGAKNIELNETEITKRVQKALEITGLEDVTDRDPHALSVGQKRRVTIASVLVMNSEIIIVDEPDTGLDHKTAREIMNRLKELNTQGKTIILISHSLELVAEYCTRAIGMKEGNIVSLKEVLKDYLPDETLTY